LSLTGFSIGAGITIQWEQSPTGAGMWSSITGATSSTASVALSGATDYRAMVTCSNGGGFDVSNTISINVNPFYLCYCSPNTGVVLHSSSGNYITNVAIPTTTLNSSSSAAGAGGYTLKDYTTTANTASLVQGQTYTFNATISSASYKTELWIDWDQNGSFDSTEYITLSQGTTSSAMIQIPASSTPGLTGMRVRTLASSTASYGSTGACASNATAGETEDYVITIVQGVQCAGVPSTTGSIAATNTTLCNGASTSFTLTGFPQELGIIYQWQSSQ
jgi:hypothetical protein